MTSQPGQQIITIQLLPNILRSKGIQTMNLGQSIEYKMRNIFLEKPYRKYGGETSPGPLNKKLKLNISLDQQSEKLVFIVYPSRGLPKYLKIKVLTNCLYLI